MESVNSDGIDGVCHGVEDGVVDTAGVGSGGVDGDDAAFHHVEIAKFAAHQDVEGHVGGLGTQLGVVDTAGGEGTGQHEGVRTGVVGNAGGVQDLGNSTLGSHDGFVGGGEDGLYLTNQSAGSGDDFVSGVAGLLNNGDALGCQVFLGLGDGGFGVGFGVGVQQANGLDRKSTRLNSSHLA